jgi:RimJ/RimL family protein N-acetyltransferase
MSDLELVESPAAHVLALRALGVADADELYRLEEQLIRESDFLLRDPIDDPSDGGEVRRRLGAQKSNDITLGAFLDRRLIGYVVALGGPSSRTRATARVTIAVASSARGRGVGQRLLEALDEWALKSGIHRLELMVIVENETAIRLYARCGYQTEHMRRHTMRVKGRFVDQWSMAKLLPWNGDTPR